MRKNSLKNLVVKALSVCLLLGGAISLAGCSSSDEQGDKNEKPVKEEEVVYGVGDTLEIKDKYKVTINSVTTTDERNQYSDKNANQVVIIDYTYENIGSEGELYISEMNFKAYDNQGNVMETYPANIESYPKGISSGRKCTAQMAYGLNVEGEFELEYFDNMFNSKCDAKFKVSVN